MDSKVDYRLLLAKYMDHVGKEEGSIFLGRVSREGDFYVGSHSKVPFTIPEYEALDFAADLDAVIAAAPQVVADDLTDAQMDKWYEAVSSAHQSLRADRYAFGRACYRAGIAAAMVQAQEPRPELTVWYGAMPESNGKLNYTAVLMRVADGWDGPHITIERSEYPDRIRYEADKVRHLIGELDEEPDILTYDADKRSSYRAPVQPVTVPDGWRELLNELVACDGLTIKATAFAEKARVLLAAPAAQVDAKEITIDHDYEEKFDEFMAEEGNHNTDVSESDVWIIWCAAIAAKAAS